MNLKEALRSVQVVPVTPFDAQGNLRIAPMEALIGRLTEAGVKVVIPGAGTGEFHSLADDEIVALIGAVRKIAGRDRVVMAPLGGALPRAVALANRTAEAGADCGLVMPLEFPYLCDAAAGDYLFALLEQSPYPLLVYKKAAFPSDELLRRLAGHANFLGVKYAVNDLDAFHDAVVRSQGRLEWYCGSAERYAPYFALAGAVGYTSGAGLICPRLTLAMHAALQAGRWDEAMRLQRPILPIEHYRARAGASYNISMLKYAVKVSGIDCGPTRPGQRRLTAEEEREVESLTAAVLSAERELTA